MTQRSERWLIVGACIVLYAIAMALVVWAIREPSRWIVDSLIGRVGEIWMLVILAAPILAAGIWGMWPDPTYTPPPAANTRFPRWVRIVGNTYLALLGLGLVAAFAAMVIAG